MKVREKSLNPKNTGTVGEFCPMKKVGTLNWEINTRVVDSEALKVMIRFLPVHKLVRGNDRGISDPTKGQCPEVYKESLYGGLVQKRIFL